MKNSTRLVAWVLLLMASFSPAHGEDRGTLTLDLRDFPFTYYLKQIQTKISERWTPPRAATTAGERAIILFEIGRDGQIRPPALERSSGNALYDQSALLAVAEASPFPPLPPEFKGSSLRVPIGFLAGAVTPLVSETAEGTKQSHAPVLSEDKTPEAERSKSCQPLAPEIGSPESQIPVWAKCLGYSWEVLHTTVTAVGIFKHYVLLSYLHIYTMNGLVSMIQY